MPVNFSRHKNHLRLEKILDKEIINIGIGEGKCGVNRPAFLPGNIFINRAILQIKYYKYYYAPYAV